MNQEPPKDYIEYMTQEARQTNAVLAQIRDRLSWILFALFAIFGSLWQMSGDWPF